MSTGYSVVERGLFAPEKVPYKQLLQRAEKMGLQIHRDGNQLFREVALTDGRNYLWLHEFEGGTNFERVGQNDPRAIIRKIEREFRVKIYSEHEWGNVAHLEDDYEDEEELVNSVGGQFANLVESVSGTDDLIAEIRSAPRVTQEMKAGFRRRALLLPSHQQSIALAEIRRRRFAFDDETII